eukprot:GHVP01063529.1.p1 GENE.GHVP01063529.1~~GHVP01063529.1.p1  ORF type:complete len:438 (-),score=84.22 GHVP01063529.1:1965-3278(-)
MGTCLSSSTISKEPAQKSTDADQDLKLPLPVEHKELEKQNTAESVDQKRRRLSLSQVSAAEGTESPDASRGTAKMSPTLSEAFSPRKSKEVKQEGELRRRRLSVQGVVTQSQLAFENKTLDVKNDDKDEDTGATFNALGVSFACKKGLKPESPNQDDFFIYRTEEFGLYCVFDGHGPYGHDVSNFVQHWLPRLVQEHPMWETDVKQAMKDSFWAVHDKLEGGDFEGRMDPSLSGTTATMILHRPVVPTPGHTSKLYIAHVGDSRAVMARKPKVSPRRGKDPLVDTIDLTMDHKPNGEKEKARITAAGGVVKRLEGDIPHRVFVKGRMYPGLAMSRAIGDTVGAQAGIVPDPEVTEMDLDPDRDIFFVVASDGVWEFIESQEAAEAVAAYGFSRGQAAAEAITREAWDRWIKEEGSVVDDITIQIVYLFPDHHESLMD